MIVELYEYNPNLIMVEVIPTFDLVEPQTDWRDLLHQHIEASLHHRHPFQKPLYSSSISDLLHNSKFLDELFGEE